MEGEETARARGKNGEQVNEKKGQVIEKETDEAEREGREAGAGVEDRGTRKRGEGENRGTGELRTGIGEKERQKTSMDGHRCLYVTSGRDGGGERDGRPLTPRPGQTVLSL